VTGASARPHEVTAAARPIAGSPTRVTHPGPSRGLDRCTREQPGCILGRGGATRDRRCRVRREARWGRDAGRQPRWRSPTGAGDRPTGERAHGSRAHGAGCSDARERSGGAAGAVVPRRGAQGGRRVRGSPVARAGSWRSAAPRCHLVVPAGRDRLRAPGRARVADLADPPRRSVASGSPPNGRHSRQPRSASCGRAASSLRYGRSRIPRRSSASAGLMSTSSASTRAPGATAPARRSREPAASATPSAGGPRPSWPAPSVPIGRRRLRGFRRSPPGGPSARDTAPGRARSGGRSGRR